MLVSPSARDGLLSPSTLQVRVAVFAKGDDAAAATAAGADIVGADDLLASVMEGEHLCRFCISGGVADDCCSCSVSSVQVVAAS